MKKILSLVIAAAFVASIAAVALAATPAQVRSYINQLEAKLSTAVKSKDTVRANKLRAMIASEHKRLAEMEAASTPSPRPVAVPPPVPKKAVVAAAPQSLFGWGVLADGSLGYVMNKSVIAGRVDAILPDPLGLGPMVGLSADSVKYRVGLGGISGNDNNDVSFKGVPLFVDGLIMLPASMLGGIESYLGGGLNYLVYRSGQTSGSLGGQIYYGITGDIGIGGKSFAQLGYSILRTADTNYPRSAKGLDVTFGHSALL